MKEKKQNTNSKNTIEKKVLKQKNDQKTKEKVSNFNKGFNIKQAKPQFKNNNYGNIKNNR
jgi:hypothetical protein